MEYGDVESFLKSVSAVEIGNQTVKGTFAEIDRNSLLTDEVGNRNNARWKRAEYVIAKFTDDGVDISEYLTGWNSVANRDQTLFIEEQPGQWAKH